MKLLLLLASTLLLCQCAPYLAGRADGIDPNPYSLLEKQAKPENRDASRIRVPVLCSAALEKRWGTPKLLVGPKGGYALRYVDPKDKLRHVTIFGSAQKYPTAGSTPPPYTEDPEHGTYAPKEVSQKWQSVPLAGRTVRFSISEGSHDGNPAQISTETFRLTAADGRTASYRIRSVTAKPDTCDDAAALLKTISF